MESLHHFQHALQVGDIHAGVLRDLFRRGLEKAVLVDVADDELRDGAVIGRKLAAADLLEKVLLERLFLHQRIEEKLPALFLFVGAARVAGALRHVIAPLVVELGQAVELLLKLLLLALLVLDRRLDRIRLRASGSSGFPAG